MLPIRSAYDPPQRVPLTCEDVSLTKQSMSEECDINYILRKYQKTGVVDHFKKHEGRYDIFAPVDFHEAMNIVADAQSMFSELPSSVRSKFDNDPGTFLNFANNPANHDAMVELGLGKPPDISTAPDLAKGKPDPAPDPPAAPAPD